MDAKAKLNFFKQKFTKIERQLVRHQYKGNQYLVIRLDGVRFTTKYFRKKFVPEDIIEVINDAIFQSYKRMYAKHNAKDRNFFLAIVQVNDEVSFVINKGKNKYDQRILKILSLCVGIMSGSTTSGVLSKRSEHSANLKLIEYYDGRPLILSNLQEVNEYIEYRYLVAKKHALAKTLKFAGVKVPPKLWEQIQVSENKVKEYKLEAEFQKIEQRFSLFVPDKQFHLTQYALTSDLLKKELKGLIQQANNQICVGDSNLPNTDACVELMTGSFIASSGDVLEMD